MAKKRKIDQKKNKRSRIFKAAGIILTILICYGAYNFFLPNTGSFQEGDYFYIRTGTPYKEVLNGLKEGNFVKDIKSFDLLAKQVKYPNKVKAGRYKIESKMNNWQLVKLLGSGRQEPVKLILNKFRTKQDIVRYISSKLEADSNVLYTLFQDDTFLRQYGLNKNTAITAIMPDTYEFWWNTDAEKVFKKIADNYQKFWNEEKKKKAEKLGLSPAEITIIASIVEEETNKNDEKSKVASVYINRLRKNMRLQADPTVKFAIGDFTIKRILNEHTRYESPYNTYKHFGLPPGPICTPSSTTINAVLNAPTTDYLFFCAKADFSGYHVFAATYETHLKNAVAYWQALNARGIK